MKKIFWSLVAILILGLFVGTAVFLYGKSQEKPIIYETTLLYLQVAVYTWQLTTFTLCILYTQKF